MPDNKITFYTNPMSRGRVVRWMLEEIGCPYDTHILEYGTTMKASAYTAINPMGKVPAITHGDAIVTETTAICTYLAQAFPSANLTPSANDHTAWASYFRFLFFIAGPVEAAVTDKSLSVDVPQDKQGFVGYGNFQRVFDVLETMLKGKTYVAGDRFSAADLIVTAYLDFYISFGSIPANQVFVDYINIHKNRSAALRAKALDDALLEQSKAS